MREAAGPTTASKAMLKRIARFLKGRQRCVLNFPWVGKAGRRHPCDCGCRLGLRPKDKVLHVWWSVGNRSALHSVRHWSVTQGTVSLFSAESEAKAITKGCIEALHVEHQTARPFKIEVWTDSSSAKAIMQRHGPGRRAKHLEVQTMWVQQWNKIGLISLDKLNTQETVADLLTKHVPRSVLFKLAGRVTHFLMKKLKSFKITRTSLRIAGIRKWQQLRACRCSTMKRTNRWRTMFTASWTKRLISRQPFLGGVLRTSNYNHFTPTTATHRFM